MPSQLNRATQRAEKAERQRQKRIKQKQSLYNQMVTQKQVFQPVNELVLDIDSDTKQPLVEVNESFLKRLKPHQVKGVRFMFESTIESVQQLTNPISLKQSFGCILAHSCGLGKVKINLI